MGPPLGIDARAAPPARWRWPWIGVAAAFGVVWALLRTASHGAAVTPDSVGYLSIAANLLEGAGLRDYRGYDLLGAPPLFALILAAAGSLGGDLAAAGRWINALAFGLVILIAGAWLRRRLRSTPIAVVAVLALVGPFPLSNQFSYIMSEPLFILWTVLALAALDLGGKEMTWRWLTLAAVCAGLAALTRFAGVAVIATGVAVLLAGPRPRQSTPQPSRAKHGVRPSKLDRARGARRALVARRCRQAGLYACLATAPLAAVIARNWILTGRPFRQRLLADQTWAETMNVWFGKLSGAFPLDAVTIAGLGLGGGAAAILALGALLAARRGWWRSRLAPAWPWAAFVAFYMVWLAAVLPRAPSVECGLRCVVPVYVPLLLTAALILDLLSRRRAVGWAGAARRLGLAAGLGAAAFGVYLTFVNIRVSVDALDGGYGGAAYNTESWRRSPAVAYLRRHPPSGRAYSNCFGALHFLLVLQAEDTHAVAKFPTLPLRSAGLPRLLAGLDDADRLVWFDRPAACRGHKYGVAALARLPMLERVAEFEDAALFRLAHRPF